jgi:hypothetical protein
MRQENKNKRKQILEKIARTRTMKNENDNHTATNGSMY